MMESSFSDIYYLGHEHRCWANDDKIRLWLQGSCFNCEVRFNDCHSISIGVRFAIHSTNCRLIGIKIWLNVWAMKFSHLKALFQLSFIWSSSCEIISHDMFWGLFLVFVYVIFRGMLVEQLQVTLHCCIYVWFIISVLLLF